MIGGPKPWNRNVWGSRPWNLNPKSGHSRFERLPGFSLLFPQTSRFGGIREWPGSLGLAAMLARNLVGGRLASPCRATDKGTRPVRHGEADPRWTKKKCPKIFGEVAVLELRRFRHRNHERETPSRKKRPSKRTPVASSNPAKHPVRTQTSLRDARRLATASAASKKSLEKIRESFPLPIPVEGVFGGIDCPQSTFQHFFFLFIWGPGPVGSAPLPLPPSPGRRGPGAWDPALAG